LIGVSRAISAAHIEGVQLVAITIAISLRDVRASTVVDVARSVTDSAFVEGSNAEVYVIADAVFIGVSCAISTAVPNGVQLVSVAVAVAFGKDGASAFINSARSVANAAGISGSNAVIVVVANTVFVEVFWAVAAAEAQGIKLVAVAVAVSFWYVGAAAFIDFAWTVANAASIEVSDTRVFVIADAILIVIRGAVSATLTECVLF
jgi:hypothetical protein